MSFPRAKRFNYKYSDFNASPADYYITSQFGNGLTIPKCTRFFKGNDQSSSTSTRCEGCTCSRCPSNSTRYVDITSFSSRNSLRVMPEASSTPDKSKSRNSYKMKNQGNIFDRNNVKARSFRCKGPNKQYLETKNEENPDWASNDLFDDDYHSYTSSEELDSMKRYQRQNDNFETNVLKQMERINLNIQKFQIDLKELKDDLKSKLNESRTIRISEGVKYVVYNAIEKMRNEFESTQNLISSQALKRIDCMGKEIRDATNLSKYKIDEFCGKIAADMIERIFEFSEKDDTLEYEVSNVCDEQLQRIDSILSPDFMGYENVCKVLSDHLQISQKELNDLNEENSSMMKKFGSAKQAIDAQSTIIMKLHKDLAELKNSYKK
ncbi:uncharacterized protein LOC130892914 [Diorhabda carinulata]|uniref:uncharacterized protein LOC130892914 n=1 Tax=Diorhabda carinulata TaxID=1163345 RepID=UPI0025A14D13|nr:uncharacterized protein LOC130892914 [Diorhabda carinulata]